MTFDLQTAYARTGLEETPENSAALTGVMAASLTAVEKFLNRLLPFAQETVEVLFQHSRSIQLSRYPVERIVAVSANAGGYQLHNATGMILFAHNVCSERIQITYEGGYRQLPADLELALWLVFDALLPLAIGDQGGAGSSGSNAVESVTITGVGTVRFATSSSSSSSTSGDPTSDLYPQIPATAMGILRFYRLEAC